MCTNSDDSREPAHRRTLCRNDVGLIKWVDWRYLLIVRFRHLTHTLSHYVKLHARLFGSMRALLHAYLMWSFFLSEPPSTYTAFMCARTQQWIRCACEQRMPWWDCAFAQVLLSCRCSHINRQVCLISWHVFQTVFCGFVPEEEEIRAWRRSRF